MTSKEAIEIARNVFQFENGEETDEWSRGVIEALEKAEKDLEVLHFLALMFDNNTLYRAMPYEKAKIISDYIDKQNKFHPEIRETLNRISNEERKDKKEN